MNSLELNLSKNAVKVLEKRYLKRDTEGNVTETPHDLFERVAATIASADREFGASESDVQNTKERFYDFISNGYFMPNSPTLMNAGRELGQLSACFVLPVEDSLEGIFETIKNTALIHKSGGGTGFSFSRLRPKNDVVHSTMGVSSGPVSFMEVFNAATEAVKQGGTRRGANMGILRVDHPDILDFINCKNDLTKLNNFNISIAITDKFMQALKAGEEYELIHPNTKECVKKMQAREVFDIIVKGAWASGEPGIIFIDNINKDNPTPRIGEIESTNPCGEVPLLPYEACNLGSINLSKMLKTNASGTLDVDWNKLSEVTKLAVHFLDNVIVVNNYPLPEIAKMVSDNRKIGLGVMGLADMLMQLGISYDSNEGCDLGARIMEFIDYHSKIESVNLSEKRGRFNNFEGSVYDRGNYLYEKYKGKSTGTVVDDMWRELDERIGRVGIRNATTTCIAPTGTISMIAGCSGGIEPLFGLVFTRDIMDGTRMLEVNPIFEKYAKENGFYSKELMDEIAESGTIAYSDVKDEVKKIFSTAHDVSPTAHINMQAAFQLHTDNAVSKTINFEENATVGDVAQSYIMAYDAGLKGLTVYRNNSRGWQPMVIEKKTEEPKAELEVEVKLELRVCPECNNSIEMAEGCFICLNCGYSGCS
ncbi:ribonucleoside-diphosphate reductase alpha chain [Candidatus Gastranaerophilus sp. (ex Termes propinquus)]|nr:ribonucleoside-diphosphate reductase alpha chain [Candidatus Gastranaerophilus sp. (ex Termes propinquus)]